jgi:hypothetical protein
MIAKGAIPYLEDNYDTVMTTDLQVHDRGAQDSWKATHGLTAQYPGRKLMDPNAPQPPRYQDAIELQDRAFWMYRYEFSKAWEPILINSYQ